MMRKEKKKETKKKTCKTSKAFFILPLSLYLRRFRANKFVNWQTCQEKKKKHLRTQLHRLAFTTRTVAFMQCLTHHLPMQVLRFHHLNRQTI